MSGLSEHRQFAICVTNDNCDDLQVLKIYQLLPDEKAAEENYVRIIDDSGEDYLYPESCFVMTEFSEIVTKQLTEAIPSAV